MNNISVSLESVTVRRSGHPRPALDAISLSLKLGQFIAVCGPNGAGKSTLARTIAGLYPLASGHIRFGNQPSPRKGGNPVHMVFQPAMAQILGDTVFEELSITLLQQDASRSQLQLTSSVKRLCQSVGLDIHPKTLVRTLSGGQLQRLCIAGAIASGARILVIDEGLSGIDPAATHQIRAQLRRIANDGTTVLLVTHDMEDVLSADRVVVMRDGRIVADETPTSFFYGERADISPPCCTNGFQLPYLVQVATEWNRLSHEDGAIKRVHPLSEREWMEVIQSATNRT